MQTEKIAKITQEEFKRQVSQTSEPVVVDFYADWCPPCKIVSPILENLSSEYSGRVRFAKVNVDDYPELASEFGIMSIPTVVFFRRGKAQDAVIGAVPSSTYKQKIEAVLKTGSGGA
jgi:thioredoxin